MTTCLARVLYDTIIESVESRIRRDGWIKAEESSEIDDQRRHRGKKRGHNQKEATQKVQDKRQKKVQRQASQERKQTTTNGESPQHQQISEETFQRIISRWHEKITETGTAPPVIRALNTRRYSRVDTGVKKTRSIRYDDDACRRYGGK
eukprot:gb/GECG01005724.1/.p1 GENE.gb/GECG01005724.1/~~gb/GECG01005724.1/.p1  ORF type:complete len:149 (+),score=19.47 gb/GECG01005724.1/:1-447(+)